MGDDDLTLTPVYRFEWTDGSVRRTDDPDAFTEEARTPAFVEWLASYARENPDCDVTLLGMGA